jgi:hypothetical protein
MQVDGTGGGARIDRERDRAWCATGPIGCDKTRYIALTPGAKGSETHGERQG